eukprot:3186208-Lingulodinium_polyedra.AAC.1
MESAKRSHGKTRSQIDFVLSSEGVEADAAPVRQEGRRPRSDHLPLNATVKFGHSWPHAQR